MAKSMLMLIKILLPKGFNLRELVCRKECVRTYDSVKSEALCGYLSWIDDSGG